MKRLIGRLAMAVGCIVVLTGASWETRLPAPSTTQTPAYTIFDKRPSSWQKNETTSSGCADGAYRVGERYFDPKPTVLLHAMLVERFGDRLAGKTVHVRGFSVHLNQKIRFDKMQQSLSGVSVNPLVIFGSALGDLDKDNCPKQDIFGSYSPEEVPKDAIPLIVAADLAIDGKRYMGRAIAPAPQDWPARTDSPQAEKDAWNAAVTTLVEQALKQLGDNIEAGLAETPAATQ